MDARKELISIIKDHPEICYELLAEMEKLKAEKQE